MVYIRLILLSTGASHLLNICLNSASRSFLKFAHSRKTFPNLMKRQIELPTILWAAIKSESSTCTLDGSRSLNRINTTCEDSLQRSNELLYMLMNLETAQSSQPYKLSYILICYFKLASMYLL